MLILLLASARAQVCLLPLSSHLTLSGHNLSLAPAG
jgi:hypothetical protein